MFSQSTHEDNSAPSGQRTEASSDGSVGFASPKQLPHLYKAGWTDEHIAQMDKQTLRNVMDGIFNKGPKIAPPTTVSKPQLRALPATGTDGKFFEEEEF